MVAEYEREEAERQAREKQDHIDRILSSSGLRREFKARTLATGYPVRGQAGLLMRRKNTLNFWLRT